MNPTNNNNFFGSTGYFDSNSFGNSSGTSSNTQFNGTSDEQVCSSNTEMSINPTCDPFETSATQENGDVNSLESSKALLRAAKLKKWDEVSSIINSSENLDCNFDDNNSGETALCLAASNNKWKLVESMVRKYSKVDCNAKFRIKGRIASVFWAAAQNKQWKLIEAMLEKNSSLDCDACPSGSATSLWYAAKEKEWGIVKMMLNNNSSLNCDAAPSIGSNCNKGRTCFWIAAENFQRDIVWMMLKANPLLNANANPVDSQFQGMTCFWLIALMQQWDIVEFMLINNPSLKCDTSPLYGQYKGITCLWFAARKNKWDIVKLMLEKYPLLNVHDRIQDCSVKSLAEMAKKNDILQLIDRSSLAPLTDQISLDLLVAIQNQKWDEAHEIILQNDILDCNIEDKNTCETALWLAAYYRQWNLVTAMIKKYPKANCDARTLRRQDVGSVLWLAIDNGKWDIVKLMFKKNKNLNCSSSPLHRESQGMTCLWLAAVMQQQDIVKFMLKMNPRLDVDTPVQGRSVRSLLENARSDDIIQLIDQSSLNLMAATQNQKWDEASSVQNVDNNTSTTTAVPAPTALNSRTVKKRLTSLTRNLDKEWFGNAALRKAFLTSYTCRFPQHCCDVGNSELLGGHRSIFNPLIEFLTKYESSAEAKLAVGKVINYFQIYSSDASVVPTELLGLIPIKNSPPIPHGETSTCQVLGVTLFFQVREAFRTIPNTFNLADLEPSGENVVHQPLCIFIDQDRERAIAFATILGLDSKLRLRTATNNCSERAKGLFDLLNASFSVAERQLPQANLSLEQLDQLDSIVMNSPVNAVYVMEIERERIAKDSENLLSARDHEALEDDAAEIIPNPSSYTTELRDDSISLNRRGLKRPHKSNEKSSKKQRVPMSGVEERHYKNAQNQFNQETLSIRDARNPLPSEGSGVLPTSVLRAETVNDREIDVGSDTTNPWLRGSLLSLRKLKQTLSNERMRRNALQCQPLDYPILSELAKVGRTQNIVDRNLHPGIKKYQKEMINKWLSFRGVASLIIAAEPGLGKTWIASEILGHVMLEHPAVESLSFFLGPMSTVNQSAQRIKDYFIDLYRFSWVARSKAYLQAGDPLFLDDLRNELSKFIQYPEDEFERWKALLPVIAQHMDMLRATYPTKTIFEAWVRNNSNEIQGWNQKVVEESGVIPHTMPRGVFQQISWTAALIQRSELEGNINISPDQAKSLGSWPIPSIISCPQKSQLLNELKKPTGENNSQRPRVIVSTAGAFSDVDNNVFPKISIPLVVLDEAQNAHNDDSQLNRNIKAQITGLRKDQSNLDFLLMTGTPLENNIAELWTLMSLAHSEDLFPSSTQKALAECVIKPENGLRDLCLQDTPQIRGMIKDSALIAFSQLWAFSQVASQLVLNLKMKSETVREAWNGRVPTKKVKFVKCDLSESSKDAIIKMFRQRGQGHVLAQNINATKIFLGNIENLQQEDPQIQELIQKINQADMTELEEIAVEIPMLGILKHKSLKASIQNSIPVVIAADHIVTTKIVRTYVTRLYSLLKPGRENESVQVLTGEINAEERKLICKKFKDTNGILIMSAKVGGVGLDFPEALKLYDLTSGGWNPGTREQLWARIIRVGHEGKRKIYVPQFGIPQEEHFFALREGKRLLKKFIFADTAQSPTELFTSYGRYLKEKTTQALLNHIRNAENGNLDFDSCKLRVHNFIDELCQSQSAEQLQTFLNRVKPVVQINSLPEVSEEVIVVTTSSTDVVEQAHTPEPVFQVAESSRQTLSISQDKFFMIPLPKTWDEITKSEVGAFLVHNAKNQVGDDVEALVNDIDGDNNALNLVREGRSEGNAGKILQILEKWRDKSGKLLIDEMLPTMKFRFDSGSYHAHLERADATIENSICLYSSSRYGGLHFDLLLPRSLLKRAERL